MDKHLYNLKQQELEDRYESLCKRCGQCCGVLDGDLCLNLVKQEDGRYYCRVYENRVGLQKTLSGKVFSCVPMRDLVKFVDLPYKDCPYLLNK